METITATGPAPPLEQLKVYCILSDERVYHARSPAIFTTVMRNSGMNGVYVPFKVEPSQLGYAMKSLQVLNLAGANITVPYKQAVVPYMDILSEGAQIIGSVNTIVIKRDVLKGYNTNAIGIMNALRAVDFDPSGKPAMVFGTGGAARAVVFILKWLNAAPIWVAGRNKDKAVKLVQQLGGEAVGLNELAEQPLDARLVVNATSVSQASESPELAVLAARLQPTACDLMFDLNYDRPDGFWQALAQKHHIRFMDGLRPLAHQASHTLALWTKIGIEAEKFLVLLDKK